jgi:hypothetical protein
MYRIALAVLGLVLFATGTPAQFTPGQVVVLRIGGDGAFNPGGSSLASSGTAGFLDQFTASTANQTAPTLTVPLPTTTSGGVNRITFSGTNVPGGQITRAVDGQSLVVAGYDVGLGQTTTTSSNNRVIAQVGFGATVSTPVLSTTYSGTSFHCAVTNTGANFWAAGLTSGTFTYQPGGNGQPGTQVQSNVPNTRFVNIFNGQLYVSSSAGTRGIFTVGTGTPTSFSNASLYIDTGRSSLPASVAFAPGGSVAYVADERTAGSGGGVQRWTFDGSTWTLAYTLPVSAAGGPGARGLAVDFSGANPVLFATTAETSANRLVAITDIGAGSSFVNLAQSPANTVFKGVALSPTPIPEPAAGLAALAAGLLSTGFIRRRWR